MKVTIDIDCTPEEARMFFGLPDVKPMQATMMKQMEERMTVALSATDPETLVKTWLPLRLQGMEQLQKMSWSQMGGARPGEAGGKGRSADGSK
jgi:hypothetical protein